MAIRRRIAAIPLAVISFAVLGLPSAAQESAPVVEGEPPEVSPCAPEPPAPEAPAGEEVPGVAEPVAEPPAPVRPPELAFVNGRCIPIAELSRLLANYEGAVAEEAEALIELREQLDVVDGLHRQLDATEISLAEVVRRDAAAEAEARYATIREDIAGEELAIVEAELAVQRDLLRDQAIAAYVTGGDPSTTVEATVLEAADVNDIAATRTYGRVVVETQVDRVQVVEDLEIAAELLKAELVAAREHAQAVEEDVSSIRRTAQRLLEEQRRLVDDAEVAAEDQAGIVASIQQRRDQFAGELGLGASSSGRLGTVLGSLGDGTASLADVGTLASPLAATAVSSGFGPRLHPIFNEVRVHTGLDLNSPAGAPIFAVADGVVVVASEEGGYGLAVAIDHGNGIATLYAHQSAFAVNVGQEVSAGEVIGFVGSTGFSTGPHLHFELRLDGAPVDALPFVDLRNVGVPPETALVGGGG